MPAAACRAGLTLDEGGKQEIVLGVDDKLIGPEVDRSLRRIPRADVAELAVQSLVLQEASNRSRPGPSPLPAFFSLLLGPA